MSKQRAIFLLGIWVLVLPFLGFPNSWRKVLFSLAGFFLIYMSYTLRRRVVRKRPEAVPFKDNIHELS